MDLKEIVDFKKYDITDPKFQTRAQQILEEKGALVLPDFMKTAAVEAVRAQSEADKDKAYFCVQEHNVYLTPPDNKYDMRHPRNRNVISSKGCITDDIVPQASPLRTMYDAAEFQEFLCAVLNEAALFPYADPLSSINVHYASNGQELGWHFDNSSFATTLMIQKPEAGGTFDYVENVRDADAGEMNFDAVEQVLDGKVDYKQLSMEPGTLVLFRGRNALHRVAPVIGDKTRILVVLAYNAQPGIALSESARKTFYGRLG
ncbi:HalD/BesD family halogenase [Sneathiella aquimaris]|uniref:HalD/BesD family halogenase n=1 Tax=Sneathiella aquimaris TaxID=2599305 RepID=UPI00146BA0C5|nr:2OG-Fe(II) oxygenase [Sneathiella aquimaris]